MLFAIGGRRVCGLCRERAVSDVEGKIPRPYQLGVGAPDFMRVTILLTVLAVVIVLGMRIFMSEVRRESLKVVAHQIEKAQTKAEEPEPRLADNSGAADEPAAPEETSTLMPEPWAAAPPSEWPRITLTNLVNLQRRESLAGGSAVLLTGESGALYGVTASHLLGELDTSRRDIAPTKLKVFLKDWTLHLADNPQAAIAFRDVNEEVFTKRFQGIDLLILTKPDALTPLPATALRAERIRARAGEDAFIVGVSSDDPQQRQQVFPCKVKSSGRAATDGLSVSISATFNPDGFSGAPIVNARGHLIGILTRGRKSGDEWTIFAVSARSFAVLIE